jgi:hypothetical protein
MDLIVNSQIKIFFKITYFYCALKLNLFLSIAHEKRVSYQQCINVPHSRNNGQETKEKDTAIGGSNFLNR